MSSFKKITAQEIIEKLNLKPLPLEGGFFRQTYKSDDDGIPAKRFGIESDSIRKISTAIYYLVTPDNFSALHRVKSDEIFHFYCGDPVELIQLDQGGSVSYHAFGSDITAGQYPQLVVPKGVWQGLKIVNGGDWALMGTTVAPGFEYEDFELGDRVDLISKFPQHRDAIIKFTRDSSEGQRK